MAEEGDAQKITIAAKERGKIKIGAVSTIKSKVHLEIDTSPFCPSALSLKYHQMVKTFIRSVLLLLCSLSKS